MKFPSVSILFEKSVGTAMRFPFALASAVLGSWSMIGFIDLPNDAFAKQEMYMKLGMTCCLALSLFISATVCRERLKMGIGKFYLLNGAIFALLFAYYFSVDDVHEIETQVRFVLFLMGVHLLVAVIPYLGCKEYNGFWQYNKSLFLRFLTAALYSGVLFVGIALALVAIDNLFEAHINNNMYPKLWMIVAGIFNTWFFLAGVPSDYESLQQSNEYPKGLKVFTQYVLLPLVVLYLGILYAYEIKIVATQHWPVGWVSYLVIGFSVAGILSLLLIWPVRDGEGNAWMRSFSRFFYFAIFPLIVLLFFAIKKRIEDYGITENRYFVLVLALWLVFIAVYFLISKRKNIKLIPISLCLIVFLTSFGPWGAFQVSTNSQTSRFMELVEKNNMLSDGKVSKASEKIVIDDQREISSIVEYLVKVHGYKVLQPCFSENLDSLIRLDSTIQNRRGDEEAKKILGLINISFAASQRASEFEEKYIDFRSASDRPFSIEGYHCFISDYTVSNDKSTDTICSSYVIGKNTITICFDVKKSMIAIQNNTDSLLSFDVLALLNTLKKDEFSDSRLLKVEDMILVSSNERLKSTILFKSIYGSKTEDAIVLQRLEADIFIRFEGIPMKEENEK